METPTKRMLWLDNLKGFLILSVVLGHCIQITLPEFTNNIVFRYIYSFHMALFMFVSGFACYRTDVKWNIISRRAKQLLLPFLVWSLVMCLIRGQFQLWDMIISPEKSFWFLWVLFFITVLHVVSYKIASVIHVKDELTTLLMALVLFAIAVITHTNIFSFQLIAYHFVFYTLGFYGRKYAILEKIPKWSPVVSLVVWAILAWFWAAGKPIQQLDYNNPMITTIYHYIVAGMAIVALVPLSFRFLKFNSLILNKVGGCTRYLRHSFMSFITIAIFIH